MTRRIVPILASLLLLGAAPPVAKKSAMEGAFTAQVRDFRVFDRYVSGAAGAGFDGLSILSGSATDGHVMTADGSGGVAWEASSGGLSAVTSDATLTGDGTTGDPLGIAGGGGTDDQTAAEVPVTVTGFTGNLSATDTDVQTALNTIDAFTLGGGGAATTSEQRVESVTFADIDNITSTAMTLTLAATTPVAVEFGDGVAEMLSGTAGETTFTIAESGVYIFGFEAIYPADGDRTTPFVEVQQDSDDAVIGRSTNAYLRNSGSPEDGLVVVLDGFVSVPTDAIVVKLVLGNSYNQNSMDADGGKFSLVRISAGLRGPRGPTGVAGAAGAAGTAGADGADGATGVTVENSGTQQGTGVTTFNFGANISATVTGTEATIVGQAGGGGGGLSSVTSDATLAGDGTAADPLMVADDGVDTAQLADDAVTQAKLAGNSVHGAQIANNAVGTSEIAGGAVGTGELGADAVTEAKIADSAVGHDQLASNSVREPEIQANAVTNAKMADDSVDTLELQDGAVTVAKMDSGTATDGHVATADGSGGVAYEAVTGGGTTFDIQGLPAAISITGGDLVPFADASDSHTMKRTTQHVIGTHMAGSGLDVSATGQLGIDINELPALSNFAGGDLVALSDASDSHTDKRGSLASIAAHLAGTNLTASADGVLSASGGGGGGGTDDQTAAEVTVTVTGFTGNLSGTDDDVQTALDTIDGFELENTFRGAFNSNRTYDGGEMVIHNGLEYISLIRNNTNEPTRSEEQWSAQPRGYIFRGDAPVASTTYQQSHMVRVPAENSWYMATLQGGAQATRAQIPTHTDFQPFVNRLTDANIANDSATIKGVLSGSQLHDFAPALGIAEATSKTSDEFGRLSGRRLGEAIDAHVVRSTNATTDVAAASEIGTSLELSRDDHTHRLPIDNTLEFNASDELASTSRM